MKVNIRKKGVEFSPFILELKIENLYEAEEIRKLANGDFVPFNKDVASEIEKELSRQGFEIDRSKYYSVVSRIYGI